MAIEGTATAQHLSAAQLGVWLGCKVDANCSAYNLGQYVEILGPIRPELLERALAQAIREAETLRVSLLELHGIVQQRARSNAAFSLLQIDVSADLDPESTA